MLTKLYVSAQVALPDWARGRRARGVPDFHLRSDDRRQRGLGEALRHAGVADRLFRGGGGIGSRDSMTWRWKLQTGVGIDFSPAIHWRAPIVARSVENNQGPVVAVVEYRVDANDRAEFLSAVDELDTRESATAPMRGEFTRTSPTADASLRPSRSNSGSRCCISASGRPTPTNAPQPGSRTAQRGAAHHAGRLPRAAAPALAKARGRPRALSASVKAWATRGGCCFFGGAVKLFSPLISRSG